MIAFQTDAHIKIKPISREAKDIDIPTAEHATKFTLSQFYSWLYVLHPNHLLEVFEV